MSSNDSTSKTIIVATILCVVCSIFVSLAAVTLRPMQIAEKEKDFKKNILQAAGMYDATQGIEEQFSQFSIKIVDLDSGKFTDAVADVDGYDQVAAARDSQLSDVLDRNADIAKLIRRERYAKVYTVDGDQGIERIILPIRGYGLWGTLYGLIALEADAETVVGLGFYEHKETPGLGGEVDNIKWKNLWPGKKVYNDSNEVAIQVIKGQVDLQTDPNAVHKVDGLSGATLTSRGVHNMLQFWLGDQGYANFLANLKRGEA